MLEYYNNRLNLYVYNYYIMNGLLMKKSFFQLLGDSPKEYDRYIFEFSIKNQLRYRGSLGKCVFKGTCGLVTMFR